MRCRGVDALRGWAAAWVVAFHYYPADPGSWLDAACPPVARVAHAGGFGVAMFFVVSGFCIAAAAARSAGRPAAFAWRRLVRILPPFWAAVAASVAVPHLVAALGYVAHGTYDPRPGPVEKADFGEWVRVLTLTQGILTRHPDWDGAYRNFVSVCWSLGIEVQFYALAAGGLAAGRLGPAVLAAVTALAVAVSAWPGDVYPGVFLACWPQFVLGWAVYELAARGYSGGAVLGDRAAGPLALVVLAGVVAGTAAGATRLLPARLEMTAVAALTAVGVWLAAGADRAFDRAVNQTWNPAGWGLRLLLGLGTISYSLYLLHIVLFKLSDAVARQLFPTGTPGHDGVSLALTVALCVPFYYAVERPFVGRRRAPSPALRPAPSPP